MLNTVAKELGGSIVDFSDETSLEKAVSDTGAQGARYGFVYTQNNSTVYKMLDTKITDLAIAALQPCLDKYMASKGAAKTQIDYIHGSKDVINLGKKEDSTGILLPPVDKNSFFATINGRGPLPRKSFSIGEASEKRFYVEARRLF